MAPRRALPWPSCLPACHSSRSRGGLQKVQAATEHRHTRSLVYPDHAGCFDGTSWHRSSRVVHRSIFASPLKMETAALTRCITKSGVVLCSLDCARRPRKIAVGDSWRTEKRLHSALIWGADRRAASSSLKTRGSVLFQWMPVCGHADAALDRLPVWILPIYMNLNTHSSFWGMAVCYKKEEKNHGEIKRVRRHRPAGCSLDPHQYY